MIVPAQTPHLIGPPPHYSLADLLGLGPKGAFCRGRFDDPNAAPARDRAEKSIEGRSVAEDKRG